MNVSGAHYNPAISLAFFLKKKLRGTDLVGYLISQITGGFLAAITLFLLSGSVFYVEPPSSTDLYQQVFSEVLFALIFVLVMLIFSLTKGLRKSNLIGLAVGLTFGGMLIISTPISGGILNPAISIGYSGLDLIMGGNSYLHVLLYTLAPLTGGALAAFIFTYFHQSWEG